MTEQTEIPPALAEAAKSPYRLDTSDCEALAAEIAALDADLGPDFDMMDQEGDEVPLQRVVTGAIRSAIPYRWALRWMIGAEKKERAFQNAVIAGAARRGFLRGVARAWSCPDP